MPDDLAPRPPRTVVALVRAVAREMVDELVARLRAGGFPEATAAHHPLFENIDRRGTRLTVLAARAGVTHQSMGELVAGLERHGYVERAPDPSDGRGRLVRLTPKGRRAAQRALRELDAIEREWRERLARAGIDAEPREVLEAARRPPGNG